MTNGRCRLMGSQVGPCTGSTAEIATFPALLDAVYRQIDYAVECIIAEANTTDPIHAEVAPLPFESLLVPSCIESARNVTAGGARYDFTGPVGVGSATVGDSLAAIKRFVLEEKAISLADLGQMLDADFAGDEVWRRWSRFSIWRHRGFLTDRADGSERVCGGRGRCGSSRISRSWISILRPDECASRPCTPG